MTMPMAGGLRGGERLHNDDSRLALRRPVGVLRSPVENRPVRRSDQIDGVLAPLPRGIPSARETDQLTDSALCPTRTVRLSTNCQQEEIRDHSRSRQLNSGNVLALESRGLGSFPATDNNLSMLEATEIPGLESLERARQACVR